jgi:hypothetical protein
MPSAPAGRLLRPTKGYFERDGFRPDVRLLSAGSDPGLKCLIALEGGRNSVIRLFAQSLSGVFDARFGVLEHRIPDHC